MKQSSIMGMFTFFFLSIAFSINAQFKVVGYLYNWSSFTSNANNVDYTKVTHVAIAFINPDANGNLGPITSLSTVVGIVHDNNAKVLASLGGANATSDWPTLVDPDHRTALIAKIVSFINTYNLDGIDVDLEASNIDYNYNDFILALKAAMPQGKTLSVAIARSYGDALSDECVASFDFINVMSYDQCGTWSSPCQHSSYAYANSDILYWTITRKVAKEKVILGLPSYGYRWESSNSNPSYQQIVTAFPRAANQDSIRTPTNGIIYHNGIPTIKQKTALAMEKAGGVMWWALPFDFASSDSRSLLKAMDEIIHPNNLTNPINTGNLLVFPNPFSNKLALQFSTVYSGNLNITLSDLSGKTIVTLFNGDQTAGNFNQSFTLDFLSTGMYLCKITSSDQTSTIKVLKD